MMIPVAGLWQYDMNGKRAYKGGFGLCDVLIVQNTDKQSEKSPDYLLILRKKKEKAKGTKPYKNIDDF